MSDNPVIALIGPGAIGTTIAAVLHDAGRTLLLCGRTAHPELRLRYDEGNGGAGSGINRSGRHHAPCRSGICGGKNDAKCRQRRVAAGTVR